MAWEARDRKQYYYQVYRGEGGKVRRRYLGRGTKAQAAAKEFEQLKRRVASEREALAHLEAAAADIHNDTSALDTAVHDLVESHLLLTGHYLHAGTWRKKRDTNN